MYISAVWDIAQVLLSVYGVAFLYLSYIFTQRLLGVWNQVSTNIVG